MSEGQKPQHATVTIGDTTFNRAGAVCFNRAGEVLICEQHKRAEGDPAHSLFPKGHIEVGETLTATALRELREECGVHGVDPHFIARTEHDAVNTKTGEVIEHVVIAWFSCLAVRKDGEGDRPCEWVDVRIAERILTYDEQAELLQIALGKA